MKNKRKKKSLELNKKAISVLQYKELNGGRAGSGPFFTCGSDLCNLTKEDPCQIKDSPG